MYPQGWAGTSPPSPGSAAGARQLPAPSEPSGMKHFGQACVTHGTTCALFCIGVHRSSALLPHTQLPAAPRAQDPLSFVVRVMKVDEGDGPGLVTKQWFLHSELLATSLTHPCETGASPLPEQQPLGLTHSTRPHFLEHVSRLRIVALGTTYFGGPRKYLCSPLSLPKQSLSIPFFFSSFTLQGCSRAALRVTYINRTAGGVRVGCCQVHLWDLQAQARKPWVCPLHALPGKDQRQQPGLGHLPSHAS